VAPPPQLQPARPWISQDALALVQRRRLALDRARRDGGGRVNKRAKRQLARLRHPISRQTQHDRQVHVERVAPRMEADFQANNLHAFYATLSQLGPDAPSQRPSPLKSPDGTQLHSSSQRAAGFVAHFEEVLCRILGLGCCALASPCVA
jgi:hypothetical protein